MSWGISPEQLNTLRKYTYLQSSVEDGNGKVCIWFGTQPKSELWVYFCSRFIKTGKNSNNLLNVKTIVETSAKKRQTRFPRQGLLLAANYFKSILETTILLIVLPDSILILLPKRMLYAGERL